MELDKHKNNSAPDLISINHKISLEIVLFLKKNNARVVGLLSLAAENFVDSFVKSLIDPIHAMTGLGVCLVGHENNNTINSNATSQTLSRKSIEPQDPSALNKLKSEIELQHQNKFINFIDLSIFRQHGEHIAAASLCDELLCLALKEKTNEFNLKQLLNEYDIRCKPAVVIIDS